MRRQRWQHLDREPNKPPSSTFADASPTPTTDEVPLPRVPAPLLIAARGYFLLRHYHACVEALEQVDVSHDVDAATLLGLSLGYVLDPRAPTILEQAVALAPDDVELKAALLSAQLRSGAIPTQLTPSPVDALGELTAAALWLRGRLGLQRENPVAAASSFTRAAVLFSNESPEEARGERVGACYVGATVSHLLAGDYDAAQSAFAALAKDSAAPELRSFANTLHAVAEELRGSSENERLEALRPLVELVTATQLHVGFYGTRGPVDLQWSGSDLVALTGYRRHGG